MQESLPIQRLGHYGLPALVSLLCVLPFAILEAVNAGDIKDFPVALFVFMGALAFAFFLILIPLLQSLRGGIRPPLNPVFVAGKVMFLGLVAWCLVSLILDQWPCFLGVPNCD